MSKLERILMALIAASGLTVHAATFTDATGDIDAGISDGGGTLDIVSMEVANTLSDITFTLTLNGNITATDWGNFMIGIATGDSAGTASGNGWARPINLDGPTGDMNYWIGSWVNGGGGAQLWSYSGAAWTEQTGSVPAVSLTDGVQSTIGLTASLSSLGLTVGSTIYFDAYSSGSGPTDSAVDALSNPNVAITGWADTYTSDGTTGLSSYTVVPEPGTMAMMGLGFAALGALRRRRN